MQQCIRELPWGVDGWFGARGCRRCGDRVDVVGTGPGGRIVRRDIDLVREGRAVNGASQPSASQPREALGHQAVRATEFVDIPHSGMRRAIARALTASKQNVPHFYLESTCRVESLLEMRQTINNDSQVRISINDFVLKAVGKALMDVPEMNVVWTDDAVRRFSTADVSVAVGGDHGRGDFPFYAADGDAWDGVHELGMKDEG